MKRSDGEKVRMRHAIERMRATLNSLEAAMTQNVPFGAQTAEAVTGTALEIAMQVAKHDAFLLVEDTTKCSFCEVDPLRCVEHS